MTKDPAKVAELVNAMIGHNLITKQTPKEGIPVSKVTFKMLGLRSQRSEFKPQLGQISMNKFSELTGLV